MLKKSQNEFPWLCNNPEIEATSSGDSLEDILSCMQQKQSSEEEEPRAL